MRTIYVGGGQNNKKNSGVRWKLYVFMVSFILLTGTVIKLTAPTIVEKWINEQGRGTNGYAFSIRDAHFSITKGQILLNDLKIYHPMTKTELVESPMVTLTLSWADFFLYNDRRVSVSADNVDVILSEDFSSEIERVGELGKGHKSSLYLDILEGKVGTLTIIERKQSTSRTVLELKDVMASVKDITPISINKKSNFRVSANISLGGKLNLTGKTIEENGKTPWTILGSLKDVPSGIFDTIAGDKLPFTFNESKLNAEIVAHSEGGKISGEISPDIKRLNLLEEKPGNPTRTIARALTDELTFSLAFTMKDSLSLEYEDTYRKLKNYRKDSVVMDSVTTIEAAPIAETGKTKKTSSFWPF